MKTNFWLLAATMMVVAGCASGPKPNLTKAEAARVSWSERIGTYTYDQAIADLGAPEVLGESAAGRTAEWVLRRSPQMSFGFGVGGGSFGGNSSVGMGVGTSVSPPPHGENLRLIFDQAGRLAEWTKVKY